MGFHLLIIFCESNERANAPPIYFNSFNYRKESVTETITEKDLFSVTIVNNSDPRGRATFLKKLALAIIEYPAALTQRRNSSQFLLLFCLFVYLFVLFNFIIVARRAIL